MTNLIATVLGLENVVVKILPVKNDPQVTYNTGIC